MKKILFTAKNTIVKSVINLGLCTFLLLFSVIVDAQVYSNKVVGEKNEILSDSLKTETYGYSLPIWGAKAAAKGYDLPFSAGVSVNYFGQKSDLIIEDLFVGFNNGPMFDLSEVIRFNKAVSSADIITVRPDFWLFPFLNVYGIFSKAKTSTEINAGLWLPDTTNAWSEITAFSSKANFDVTAMGFGLTPTIGIGGGWLALDMNFTWSDVSALKKPVFSYVIGPRIGKTFKFKNPQSNIAAWVGGFRVKLSAETDGSLSLAEVIEVDGLQARVDDGIAKVAQGQINADNWWNGLTPLEQKNPVNIAKYETASRALTKAGDVLTNVDGALNEIESATVQYSLNKRPKDLWNFIIGSQYQINKHIMVRAEYGFLASRTQFMAGLQYRFGL